MNILFASNILWNGRSGRHVACFQVLWISDVKKAKNIWWNTVVRTVECYNIKRQVELLNLRIKGLNKN